jgi:hypothetical protein
VGCGIAVLPATDITTVNDNQTNNCEKEWEVAQQICVDLYASGQNYNKRRFGPNPNSIELCKMGYVSQRWGGNAVIFDQNRWAPPTRRRPMDSRGKKG